VAAGTLRSDERKADIQRQWTEEGARETECHIESGLMR
jgi:hypothetical protein